MINSDTEVIFIYAVVPKDQYDKVKLPEGSHAKAMEIGEARDLCDMEACKGWGAITGIALSKLGLRLFPEIHRIMNPERGFAKQPV